MLTEGNRDVIKSSIESKLTNKNIEEKAKIIWVCNFLKMLKLCT